MTLLVTNYSRVLSNTVYLKPSKAPNLSKFSNYDKNFVKFDVETNKYQITQNIEDLKIVWETHKITGVIFLQGKYNLCYLDGLYYFLNRTKRFKNNIYRYKLVRWFWVNDCLNNSNLKITGVLQKTNQVNTVSNNILFTTPIMQSGNELTFYNIANLPDDGSTPICILEPKNFLYSSAAHFLGFSAEGIIEDMPKFTKEYWDNFSTDLKQIPLLVTPSVHRSWKGILVSNLIKFLKKNNLSLWDINVEAQSKTLVELSTKYPLNENKHYIITSSNYTGIRHFARSKAETKQISNIDLSSLTDVKKINSLNLKEIEPNTESFEKIDDKSRFHGIKRILKECRLKSTNNDTVKMFKDQIITESKLGELELDDIFIRTENKAKIITGYEIDESGNIDFSKPTYESFMNDNYSYLVNLSKYQIIHSSNEFFSYMDKEYVKFLSGEDKLFDNDTFIDLAITAFPIENTNKVIPYLVSFKNIPLEQGFCINGNNYVTYAYFQPIKSIEKYSETALVIGETEEFEDVKNFATLINRNIWWSIHGYPLPEKWKDEDRKPKDLESGAEAAAYSKKEVRDLFKKLLKSFKNEPVGNLLDGIVFQFPENSENGKSFNQFASSNTYIIDKLKPKTLKQYVYIQPLATNEKISSGNYNINLHNEAWRDKDNESTIFKFEHKGQVVEQLGEFISYKDAIQKIDEWFKYWKDDSKEGDFLLNDKVSNITIAEDLSWLCYDISKIHKGKQYKLTLLFKRNHNNNKIKSMVTTITFRRLYHGLLSKGYNSGNFEIKHGTHIDKLLWPFHICAIEEKFPVGNREKNMAIGDKGWAYYDQNNKERFIRTYERYYHVEYKVCTIRDKIKNLKLSEIDKQKILNENNYYLDLAFKNIYWGNKKVEWEDGDGFYDLVGTNFYVYKYKEYYELIVKNNAESVNERTKIEKGVFTESPLNDLDKVINSQNVIYAFGETIPIKWRGFLNTEHRFDSFSITPIEIKGTNLAYDVYELIIKTNCDFIQKYLQIMKEHSSLTSKVSISEFENISNNVRKEQKLSELNSRELELGKNKFFTDFEISPTDVNNMINRKNYEVMNEIVNLIGDDIYKELMIIQDSETKKSINLRSKDHKINEKFWEKEFKIREERLDITHKLAEIHNRKMLLNLETNARISAYNESSIYRAMKEKFKTGDIYLMNIHPEGKQLEEIKKYYSMFGYDITLYDYSVTNEELNKGLIIKFSKVIDISGAENPMIAEEIKNIFESGFKII